MIYETFLFLMRIIKKNIRDMKKLITILLVVVSLGVNAQKLSKEESIKMKCESSLKESLNNPHSYERISISIVKVSHVMYVANLELAKEKFSQLKLDTIKAANLIDDDGKKQGKWIIDGEASFQSNFKSDQKVEEGYFIDSKKTGVWKGYYPTGLIKSVITYENNRPNGFVQMYNENGSIREEGTWKNNRWSGDYKSFYQNGQVENEFIFNENGKREGVQYSYYDNGDLFAIVNYVDGYENGIGKHYDRSTKKTPLLKAEVFYYYVIIDYRATNAYNALMKSSETFTIFE